MTFKEYLQQHAPYALAFHRLVITFAILVTVANIISDLDPLDVGGIVSAVVTGPFVACFAVFDWRRVRKGKPTLATRGTVRTMAVFVVLMVLRIILTLFFL